ncbi:MAG: hypothetical protein ACR2MP_12340 [Streptosporangiaceae bacterium]
MSSVGFALRTILCNRLRWHLHELDPALQVPSRGLRRYCVLDVLASRLAGPTAWWLVSPRAGRPLPGGSQWRLTP